MYYLQFLKFFSIFIFILSNLNSVKCWNPFGWSSEENFDHKKEVTDLPFPASTTEPPPTTKGTSKITSSTFFITLSTTNFSTTPPPPTTTTTTTTVAAAESTTTPTTEATTASQPKESTERPQTQRSYEGNKETESITKPATPTSTSTTTSTTPSTTTSTTITTTTTIASTTISSSSSSSSTTEDESKDEKISTVKAPVSTKEPKASENTSDQSFHEPRGINDDPDSIDSSTYPSDSSEPINMVDNTPITPFSSNENSTSNITYLDNNKSNLNVIPDAVEPVLLDEEIRSERKGPRDMPDPTEHSDSEYEPILDNKSQNTTSVESIVRSGSTSPFTLSFLPMTFVVLVINHSLL